jgi:hypothetical protein
MKLAFKKRFGAGYFEREVPVMLNIGTLEAVCDMLKIEFHQIGESLKERDYDFIVALLYQGYITACKDRYEKPEYSLLHAAVWHEYMSQKSQQEFVKMMQGLLGKMQPGEDKKKVKLPVL